MATETNSTAIRKSLFGFGAHFFHVELVQPYFGDGWLPSAEHCSSYNLKPRFVLAPCQRYDRQLMTSGRIDLFNFSDSLFGKQ